MKFGKTKKIKMISSQRLLLYGSSGREGRCGLSVWGLAELMKSADTVAASYNSVLPTLPFVTTFAVSGKI